MKTFRVLSVICTCIVLVSSSLSTKFGICYHNSSLNEVMMQILQVCHADYKTVIVSNNIGNDLITFLLQAKQMSVIQLNFELLNDNKEKNFNEINALIVSAERIEKIIKILKSFKATKYWSINTTVFILNKLQPGCHKASQMLNQVWQMDLIQGYFICMTSAQEIPNIYTFNPYTNRAPNSWKIVKTPIDNGKSWTLYERQYNKGNICQGLNFDRTKFLDNYKITVGIQRKYMMTRNVPVEMKVFDAVKKILGINCNYKIFYVENYTCKKGQTIMKRLINAIKIGSIDLAVEITEVNLKDSTYTVLHGVSKYKFFIVSLHRGYMTPLEKIYQFYGLLIISMTILILIITFVAIIFWESNRGLSFALFELIRLVTNTSLFTSMNTLGKKLFFSMILYYFFIMHSTFQGRLSSFLTKPIERRNIEKWDDLEEFGITNIFTYRHNHNEIQYLDESRLKQVEIRDSYSNNEKNEYKMNMSSVCIDPTLNTKRSRELIIHYISLIRQCKYHISNAIHFRYAGMPVRNNWPLTERINIALILLNEYSLSDRWIYDSERKIKKHHNRNFILANLVIPVRPIALKSLDFAFYFLIFGSICGIISFVLELFSSR